MAELYLRHPPKCCLNGYGLAFQRAATSFMVEVPPLPRSCSEQNKANGLLAACALQTLRLPPPPRSSATLPRRARHSGQGLAAAGVDVAVDWAAWHGVAALAAGIAAKMRTDA